MAFLASIQITSDEDIRAEFTSKIDDKNPAPWMSLDDLKRRWAKQQHGGLLQTQNEYERL